MIGEKIKYLRERSGISQAELARRICTTRASVNAWECGLSAPTAAFLIELAKEFHVNTDYLLGLDNSEMINISSLSDVEKRLVLNLLDYFKNNK